MQTLFMLVSPQEEEDLRPYVVRPSVDSDFSEVYGSTDLKL